MLVRAIEKRYQRAPGPEPDGTQLSERGQRGISGRMRNKVVLGIMVQLCEMGSGVVLRNVPATEQKLGMA